MGDLILPRFNVSEWRGRFWLDRSGAGVDCEQCVGPFRTREEAENNAAAMNEMNRRWEAGEILGVDDV